MIATPGYAADAGRLRRSGAHFAKLVPRIITWFRRVVTTTAGKPAFVIHAAARRFRDWPPVVRLAGIRSTPDVTDRPTPEAALSPAKKGKYEY